ncbi:hypothetical protein EV668_4449 [Enterovirga rhinocerotis]|uniref:Cytochrome P450 n=2 Tax=Enterovirga rhinocerotis TaxID=1339210 RepID=A0A4R7BJY8_9HYPH|nr:hypothetical protein EV668_4449 [Enterovirga rhinocerotis]
MLDKVSPVPVVPLEDLESDPHGTFRRFRDAHPFAIMPLGGYIVLRYDDVASLARDPRLRATEIALPAQLGITNGALFDIFEHGMLTANGDVHRRRRSALSRALVENVAQRYRAHVRRSAQVLLDSTYAEGELRLVRDYAAKLPAMGLASLLGIPNLEVPAFIRDVEAMNAFFRPDVTPEIVAAAEAAAGRVRHTIEELAGRNHDERDNDFVPAYLDAAQNQQGHSRIEALIQIVQLIIGGTESIRIAIVAQTANLMAHPRLWNSVCADPKLVAPAVSEALRFEPGIAGLVRISTDDILIGEHVLPAGELVVLSLMSALRDERKFERPDDFDIFRQDGGLSNLVFGAGAHKCIADAFGRAALEEALSALTERLPHACLVRPPVFQGYVFVRASSECRIAWVP